MPSSTSAWQQQFTGLFEAHYQRLFRYLDRLSDDPELAADLAQEAFLALYRRGETPEQPGAWLISVAMNRFRNTRSTERRRRQLLTLERSEASLADPPPSPEVGVLGEGERVRVRRALDALPARDRELLLLHAEGYAYREMAQALGMNFASIGTTLLRARRAFQERYGDRPDPS